MIANVEEATVADREGLPFEKGWKFGVVDSDAQKRRVGALFQLLLRIPRQDVVACFSTPAVSRGTDELFEMGEIGCLSVGFS